MTARKNPKPGKKTGGKRPTRHAPHAPARAPRAKGARRTSFVAIGFVVLAISAALVWWLVGPQSPRRTVIVLMLDTVRQDALGCYGHAGNPTPNIDALAADGVRFDRCISTSGWTLPAVASFMSGNWPSVHGAIGKGTRLTTVREELVLAQEVLRDAGMQTVGFANAAFVSPMLGLDRGFDHFDHRYAYNWNARRADETIDAAIAEVKRRKGDAYYFIHLFDPHLDYDPPGDYAARFTGGRSQPPPPLTMEGVLDLTPQDRKGAPAAVDIDYVRGVYQGEVAFMDAHIGRFIAALKDMGLYDRSTIIVTSDHGEEFWEHGGFEHGHTLYDELVRVPLVVKFPQEADIVAKSVSAQVRIVDVMPTVFDELAIEKPASFEGVSLMSHARGERTDDLPAVSESTLYGAPQFALRTAQYNYILTFDQQGPAGGELFDWRADPHERSELTEKHPDIAERVRGELLAIVSANRERASTMSQPELVDMSPRRIDQLRSLGYIR